MKELLKKYILDSCTPEELQQVLAYIQTPQGRKELEDQLLEDWEDFSPKIADEGIAEHWQDRLTERTKKKSVKSIIQGYSWLGYAAAVLLVTGFGFYFFKQGKGQQEQNRQVAMIERHNPRGKRTIVTLADSSVVYLGAESTIRFPEQFTASKREITLEGEAFFEIKHDEQKPFIVHTGNIQTRVLGTSFKIEAFKNETLTVAVATGKVSVGYKETPNTLTLLAVLTPGKMVSRKPSDHSTVLSDVPVEDVLNLKKGNLAFIDARLDKIARDLGRWYNIKIAVVNPKIAAYQLSITINGTASISNALDAITAATGLKYRINNDQITIKER